MAKWRKKTVKLKKNHGWRGKPGYNVFVMDRGAARFNFPQDWIVRPGEGDELGTIKFHDREPPDDECALIVSYMRLPLGVDLSGAPVSELLKYVIEGDEREVISRGEIIGEERAGLSLAWAEMKVIDEVERREAFSRACIARGLNNIQCLITFDYWVDDVERMRPVWDEVLSSLEVGWFIADPTQGPVIH
jgi:hypothetical protein